MGQLGQWQWLLSDRTGKKKQTGLEEFFRWLMVSDRVGFSRASSYNCLWKICQVCTLFVHVPFLQISRVAAAAAATATQCSPPPSVETQRETHYCIYMRNSLLWSQFFLWILLLCNNKKKSVWMLFRELKVYMCQILHQIFMASTIPFFISPLSFLEPVFFLADMRWSKHMCMPKGTYIWLCSNWNFLESLKQFFLESQIYIYISSTFKLHEWVISFMN